MHTHYYILIFSLIIICSVIVNVPFSKYTGKWSANGKMCVVSQVAVDAKSQLSECWNLTLKHSLSRTWESSVSKWFNSTSKWLHERLWHKQSRWEWGDTVLNDYNSECFPIRLSSSTKINLRMWFFFLSCFSCDWIQTFSICSKDSLLKINLLMIKFCYVLFSRTAGPRHQNDLACPC